MPTLTAAELSIIALSLRVALVSMACSLPLAIVVAYALARLDFPGKTLVDAIVHLPLVLPPVVVGFALLVLLGRRGPVGSFLEQWFGIVFAFRWTGAALASAIMGFPLMIRAIRLSIAAIDRRLEVAARTLGGSPLWVFASVTNVNDTPFWPSFIVKELPETLVTKPVVSSSSPSSWPSTSARPTSPSAAPTTS